MIWGVGSINFVKRAMMSRPLAGLLLIGGVMSLAPPPLFSAYAEEPAQNNLNNPAQDLAQQIADRLSDNVKALERLSRDEGLIRLLETGDERAIAAKAQELTGLLKSAL